MTQVDTQIEAAWIIPVEPADTVYTDHALIIHEGQIHDILPTADARQRYQPHEHHSLTDHALIPGLINTHTHAAMTLFRGLADDLPLMKWLNDHIWPAEGTWVSSTFVHDGTQLAVAEMLRGGVTCFNDMYFFPQEAAKAAVDAHMRAVIGMILIDFPTVWAENADEYLHKGLAFHDEYRQHPLIRTAFAPHAPYTVSDEPLSRMQTWAEELDVPVHMHVHETADEVQQGLAQRGQRPLAHLQALGLLTPRLVGVHMTQFGVEEIDAYQAAGAHTVHCPESNMKLASGFCPVHRLLQAGVNVALGTDGAASNNDLDMFAEMRTAALLAKAVADDASALPAAQALAMATINGARALGLEQETGSLTVGKAADVVAVNLGGVATQPLYHPISQIVYAAGREAVSDVWVGGRQVVHGGTLTTVDETEVVAKAREWQTHIRQYD